MFVFKRGEKKTLKSVESKGSKIFGLADSSKNVVSVRWELAKRNDFCSGGKELQKRRPTHWSTWLKRTFLLNFQEKHLLVKKFKSDDQEPEQK